MCTTPSRYPLYPPPFNSKNSIQTPVGEFLVECRGRGCTRFRKHRARRRGRNTAREEREEEEDATRYIIVGSWHSSRTRRSLIHAWNSRESHEATRLRARSHAVGIAGEIYLCFRNFQTIRAELYVLLVEMMSFFFLRATKSNIVSSKNVF